MIGQDTGSRNIVLFTAKRIVLCVIAMNIVFHLCNASRALFSVDRINAKILRAFKNEDLRYQDWPHFDPLRGTDQFSDAVLMMQLQIKPTRPFEGIFAPPQPAMKSGSTCKLLSQMTSDVRRTIDERRPLPMARIYLHRYWEGQLPISALLLHYFELSQARLLLKGATYLAFALLAIAMLWVSRGALVSFLPVLVYGIMFSAVPYLGQLMMHMGFCLSTLSVCALLLLVDSRNRLGTLVCGAAAVGAVGVYVDQLNGVLLNALCLTMLGAFHLARKRRAAMVCPGSGFQIECAYVFWAGFALFAGAMLSYGLYLGVQSCFYGCKATFQMAYGELGLRMNDNADLGGAFAALYRNLNILTFGNMPLAQALLGISLLAWAAGVPFFVTSVFAARAGRPSDYWRVFLAHALVAATVLAWYVIFRNHTKVHAWFMGRYLYLPLALGWSNLACLASRRLRTGECRESVAEYAETPEREPTCSR